jgi:amino acid transporter
VPALLMVFLAFEGIRSSLRVALALFTAEVVVIIVLALIIVGRGGGPDGLTAAPLTPSASPNGFQGLVTGAIFAALSYVGFEGAATLSEEVREPRRTVPRAIFLSVLGVGVLYVFCVWAEVVGLGIATANATDGTATPWNDLAATFAPWMKWFVVIASVSSMFAVMVNSNNSIIRVLFVMSREGLLPSFLTRIHPRHASPTGAVAVVGIFSVVLTLVLGLFIGGLGDPAAGANVYGYLGFLLTLGVLPVYALTNVAAIRYLWRKTEVFNIWKHGVLPALGALLIIGLLIGQIAEQTTAPYTWFPWVIVAWVVIVSVAAIWLGRVRPEQIRSAGHALGGEEGEIVMPAGAPRHART